MFFIRKIRMLLTPKDKYQLLGIAVLMTVSALLEVVGTGLLIPLVAMLVNADLLEQNAYLHLLYRWAPVSGHRGFMLWSAFLAALAFVGKNIYIFWVIHVQSEFVYARQGEWGDRLFRNLLKTSYAYHCTHSPADLNAKLNRVSWVCDSLLQPALLILSDVLAVLALTLVMFWLTPGTACAAALALVVFSLVFYLPFRSVNRGLGARFVACDRELSRIRLDGLRGIKDIKAAGLEDWFIQHHERSQRRFLRVLRRFYQLGQLPRLGLESLTIVLAMGVFAGMVWLRMPVSSIALVFGLLTAVMLRVLPALSRIHYNLNRLRQAERALEDFCRDLTELTAEPAAEDADAEPFHLRQALEIRDLSFGYRPDRPVLEHFQLTLPAGSCTALTGPTGGGKTTVADLVLGLLTPREGAILADGRDIREDLAGWRKITAYVPQFIYLLNDTVRANVAFGVPPDEVDEARFRAALEAAQLTETVAALPNGADTVIGDNGVGLSGGQRQRLGIARALYRRPQLLILDEATSALDQQTEADVVAALEHLRGKLTMLVIAHRLSTIETCDRRVEIPGRKKP